jgi:hypothetical protein
VKLKEQTWVLFIILVAHSGWALYPVLNKALLAYLPPLTLLMAGNSLALAIASFGQSLDAFFRRSSVGGWSKEI